MKIARLLLASSMIFLTGCFKQDASVYLTLIPPGQVTDKVPLDVRAGIVNKKNSVIKVDLKFYLNSEKPESLLFCSSEVVEAKGSKCVKFSFPTAGHQGDNKIILVAMEGAEQQQLIKQIRILPSERRSDKTIDGAWVGLYHWSEIEGKHWNMDIKKLTDDQWREMVRSMHKLNMNIIVLQEVFRNQENVDAANIETDDYRGKAFYPSKLYSERMPIRAHDPIEAILTEADKQGMDVFLGVGLFAWFDFSSSSLEWHKNITSELWNRYGNHPSFYGFYVSEESGGSLDNWEKDEQLRRKRKDEIVSFFKEFKRYCNTFAPSKPIMLATNSMGVPSASDVYPDLLENLDILCPFGFSRMPEGDLSGEEAANLLQDYCDKAGSHLWFDLEAFLFNKDGSLYPRPIEQIASDLGLFKNFEKTLCYQYPGVFNDPESSIRVGEPATVELFTDYRQYLLNITEK